MEPAISFLLLVCLASFVYSQTLQTVQVGVQGSFYNPPALSAAEGDIITFSFAGLIHGVTQSSFEAPCTPLPGGFSSGLLGLNGSTAIEPPTWSIIVKNASAPIFFFCEATRPESHCAAGMVGAINAPEDMFTNFMAAAKAVTGTPQPTPSVALTGIGAIATASPSTITKSESSTSSPTQSASTSKSVPVGAIAGGVVGGVVAISAIIILLFMLCRQKKRRESSLHGHGADYEKRGYSTRTPRFKPDVSESDLNEPELGRYNTRVRHQQSSGGLSSTIDPRERDTTVRTSSAPSEALYIDNGRSRALQQRYDESHDETSPITMADAFNLAPTHPYARTGHVRPQPAPEPRSPPVGQPIANVHEIAKEVAALIGAGQNNNIPPPMAGGRPPFDQGLPNNRAPRQLPDPHQFSQSAPFPDVPGSPGLPQYER